MSASLLHDVDLSPFNTLALPARARLYGRVSQVAQLAEFRDLARAAGIDRRMVLGGGSNVAFTQDFPGLVLHLDILGRRLVSEDDSAWFVAGGGGEPWSDFVDWTLAQGWPGLENLALIPGTVGGAPIQNIGAYGLELVDRLHEVVAVDLDDPNATQVRFSCADCKLGYRDSRFKREGWHRSGRFVIIEVVFRLPKKWRPVTGYSELKKELAARGLDAPSAREIADTVVAIRQRKLPDPSQIPNAGSFFQNPITDIVTATKLKLRYPELPTYPQEDGRVKLAAAWMIEKAGWKGRDFGPVGMFENQALILVNREPGTARGTDVGMLAEAVRTDVRRHFGILLTPEPVFI